MGDIRSVAEPDLPNCLTLEEFERRKAAKNVLLSASAIAPPLLNLAFTLVAASTGMIILAVGIWITLSSLGLLWAVIAAFVIGHRRDRREKVVAAWVGALLCLAELTIFVYFYIRSFPIEL